jgi:hypothetical protein
MAFPSDFPSSWSATDLPRALTKPLMGSVSFKQGLRGARRVPRTVK